MSYYFSKTLRMPFDQAVEKVTEELKKEGFGILTDIDVKETLKKKLNLDFQKYKILGACNPPFAHKAIVAEENIGLMLSCNVILYEKGDKTVISIIRPTVAMEMINNKKLKEVAEHIETKLEHVIDAL